VSRIGVCALALVVGLLAFVAPAKAQSSSCDGVATPANVTIDTPAPNETLSGTVVVEGTAEGVSLSKVVVTLAGQTRQHIFNPNGSLSFSSQFDTSTMNPGPATLRVVACSANLAAGVALSRGERSIPVTIRGQTSTTAVRSSTTAPASGQAPAPGQQATASTTTPGATTTTPGSSTTVTSSPTTTEPRWDVAKSDPVRPDAAREGRMIITAGEDKKSPRPPLWVGAVVGLSGAIGLGFSAASWRRRAHAAEVAEPIDPDLVEVG
jgi:hypothetical protein